MGQRESTTPHARRVDPRWARLALEQLRDDEFLAKQLRRQETLAGARQAASRSSARWQRPRAGLFVDSGRSVSGGSALWTQLLKRRASDDPANPAAGDGGDEDDGDPDGRRSEQEQRLQTEHARDDELLHALVLLGNLSQPARAAYLLSHVQDQLTRLCHVADPVADVVALRRGILCDVYDAVAVQHQHALGAAVALQSTANVIQRAASDDNDTRQPVSAIAATRPFGSTPSDPLAAEPVLATDLAVELLDGLLETAMAPSAEGGERLPMRDVFDEVESVVELFAPLSLLQKPSPAKLSCDKTHVGRLVRKLQQFLLTIAAGKLGELGDVADRTRAVNGLVRLAAASGSVRDFLAIVSVLLGIGDGSVTAGDAPTMSLVVSAIPQQASSPRALRLLHAHASASTSPTSSPPKIALREPSIPMREYDASGQVIADDERGDVADELANFAVEQRLKQVHKQRGDHGAKELDVQTTAVDQLLSVHSKRKAGGPKHLVVVHTKAAVSSVTIPGAAGSSSVIAHRSSIPHPLALAGKSHPRATAKDELNNLSLEADLTYSLDGSTSSRSDTFVSPVSPRHAPVIPFPIAVCPTFNPLRVGEILKAMDQVQIQPTYAYGGRYPTAIRPSPHHDPHGWDDDHEVWSCGQNSYGELGHGDAVTRKSFDRVEALQQKDIVYVSAGNEHTVALSADGSVWTCGYNDNGQCGHGGTTRIPHLTQVLKLGLDDTTNDGISRVTQVHAYNGCEHTILVTHDGKAASCGCNYRGQLGHGTTQSESVPKLLRSLDGKKVRLVSCSYYHTALTCDGGGPAGHSRVYTFGRNDFGQLGHGDTIDRKVPQCVEAIGLPGDLHVVSIACGQYHTMAVTSTGKLLAFGKNDYGQLGVETVENQLTPTHVKYGLERQTCLDVRCGYYHSIVLCRGTHVFGFGRNDYGQLGIGKASNAAATNLQLQQQRFARPQLLDDLEGKEIVRVACGCYHTITVSDNGVLYVFGRNNHGQLGTGDTNERLYPYPIDSFVGKRVALVAAGFYHTLVLTGGKDNEEIAGGEQQDASHTADADAPDRIDGMAMSCSAILASPIVQELYDAKGDSTSADMPKTTSSSTTNHPERRDPSSDMDADDGRTEDRSGISPTDVSVIKAVDYLVRTAQLVVRYDEEGYGAGHPALPSNTTSIGNSLDVVVVILAQLDRLCSSFLIKKGTSFPIAQLLPARASDHLMRKSGPSADLCDFVDESFEKFAVEIHGATFTSLGCLIAQLSTRCFDALNSTGISSAYSRGSNGSGKLQAYLLDVCFRLLQANLTQVLHSGLGSLLIALQQTSPTLCPPRDDNSSEWHSDVAGLLISMCQIRTLLLSFISKTRPSHRNGPNSDRDTTSAYTVGSGRAVSEAIDTLMLGFDVFFPCQCSRVLLLESLMGSASKDDGRPVCGVCQSIEWTPLRVLKSISKRPLLSALLKRLADDATIMTFLPVTKACSSHPHPPPASSLSPKRFQALDTIVEVLLGSLNSHFMLTIGELTAASHGSCDNDAPKTMPTTRSDQAQLNDSTMNVLIVIQKHVGSMARGCDQWTRSLVLDTETSLSARLSRVAASVMRVGSHSDGNTDDVAVDDFPVAWTGMLQLTLRVLSQSCDVLTQVLPRSHPSSPPSPHSSSRNRRCCRKNDLVANPAFGERVAHTLERSVVGRVLPLLVSGLFAFTRIPAFAVTLSTPLQSLLKLLEEWNATNVTVKRAAENDVTHRLGKTLTASAVVASTVKQHPGGTTTDRSVSAAGVSAATTPRVHVSDALDTPWSLLLEKELAMLCAELAVTITLGGPLVHLSFGKERDEMEIPHAKWRASLLFGGGISSDYIHKSIVTGSALIRTVSYSPSYSLFRHLITSTPSFLLTIPPCDAVDNDEAAFPNCGHLTAPVTSLLRLPSHSNGRAFLAKMAHNTDVPDHHELGVAAHALCEWVRSCHARRDATYRMLLRQAQLQKQTPTEPGATPRMPVLSDAQLEEALFAALLHHQSLTLFALLVGTSRYQSEAMESGHMPPRSLLGLWRVVAEFRRRLVAKRTTIKNSQPLIEAFDVITTLHRTLCDRLHLLLLLVVDEEEEHRLCLLDGGFVASWDPAFLSRACARTDASTPCLRVHMSARYGHYMLPFLLAYPTSCWRRVRTLFHVVVRWKAVVTTSASVGSSPRSAAALEFVTADDTEIGDLHRFALALLIEPCRQLSCATRGYEILWELVSMPLLECVRVGMLEHVCHELATAPDGPFGAPIRRIAHYAYREMHRTAQNDLMAAMLQLMVEKAREMEDLVLPTGVHPQRDAALRVLLVLLRCVSLVRFGPDQYEFLNSVGLVQVLDEMLFGDRDDDNSAAENTNGRKDSIRAITVRDKNDTRYTREDEPPVQAVVWALIRVISVHVSASSVAPSVPVYPVCYDVFETLFASAQRLMRQGVPSAEIKQPSLLERARQANGGGSINSTIRRSFEIFVAPKRFSYLTKGLTFTYMQMLEPASGLLAMSPLVKPSEFSITMWIYAAAVPGSEASGDHPIGITEEKQIVFVRGDARTIAPYLLLVRDRDDKWQIEVGAAAHAASSSSLPSAATRLLWERLHSKDSLSPGRWTHIAVVVEGAKLRLYMNGILDCQRSLSGPLATALNSGSVDLDFGFGRQQPVAPSQSLDDAEAESTGVNQSFLRAAKAMAFLSTLVSVNAATSTSLTVTPSPKPLVRSFHGLLSHFRFHNRSLSPIHVRIVYDEKKPVKEDGRASALASRFLPDDTTTKMVQLHALLRVMVESDEGRVHLADPMWSGQLWEIFLSSQHASSQLSSVRLLRRVLLFQSPRTVADAICVSKPQPGYRFVVHILRIIGACLLPVWDRCDSMPATLQKPKEIGEHETAVELRNSTAERLLLESARGSVSIPLANELTGLLIELLRNESNASWPAEIWKAFGDVLWEDSEAISSDVDQARIGCLYVLGGSATMLTSGTPVDLKGTNEQATVIAVGDPVPSMVVTSHTVEGVSTNRHAPTVYACIQGEDTTESPRDMIKDGAWSDQVHAECVNYRKHQMASSSQSPAQRKNHDRMGEDDSGTVPFVRLHRDDVAATSPINVVALGSDKLTSETLGHLYRAALALASEECAAGVHGVAELKRWLSSGLIIQAVLRVASDHASASHLLRDGRLVLKMLEISSSDDGNPHFSTFEHIERKLWIVRTQVYQVLHDLQEQGEVEVDQWLKARRAKAMTFQKSQSDSKSPTLREDEDDVAFDRTDSIAPSTTKLDLRLDLAMEDPANDQDTAESQRSYGSSSASPDDNALDTPKRHPQDCPGDVDDQDDDKDGEEEGEEDDEEDDDDGEDDDDEDEDDEDAAENRQAFVDELMMMGFPEEWCVLALKQTENDIISASAWIVDNLDYLSRLQTTLDKQRDQSAESKLVFEDEDDDEDKDEGGQACTDGEEPHPATGVNDPPRSGQRSSGGLRSHPQSPMRSDGPQTQQLINEKEMGRKIFGEIYFPFEAGGFDSNAKDRFFTPWRSENASGTTLPAAVATATTATENSEDSSAPQQFSDQPLRADADTIGQFAATVEALELCELLDRLVELERAFLVLSCRQVIVSLLQHHDGGSEVEVAAKLDLPSFFTFLKLVVYRGPQFQIRHTHVFACGDDDIVDVETVLRGYIVRMLHEQHGTFAQRVIDYALVQIEAAAISSSTFEAILWTQRELRRADKVVLEEPAVELAAWLLDLVLGVSPNTTMVIDLSSEQAVTLLQRLRPTLRSSNLPVKFIVITTLSRVLQRIRLLRRQRASVSDRPLVSVLDTCRQDVASFLCAARNRFVREQRQRRAIFSLYLLAYVEIIYLLQQVAVIESEGFEPNAAELPPPIPTSCLDPASSPAPAVHYPILVFDRAKSRSSLLQISDDGLTAAYSGNDLWKTVLATQSFATGIHEWHLRIEKSSSSYLFIGVATRKANLESFLGADDQSWGFIGDKAVYYQRNRLRVYGDAFGEGDVVGVHLDCERGTLGFSKNGVFCGVAFENLMDEVFPAVAFYSRHQKVSIVWPDDDSRQDPTSCYSSIVSDGTVEEAVAACEMMDTMVASSPHPPRLLQPAYEMTMAWCHGTGRDIMTRAGSPLWVDTTSATCAHFGFQADEQVRCPRGNGRVLGVADDRLWVEVDGEPGAWHIHPSKLRTMKLSVRDTPSEPDLTLLPEPRTSRAPVAVVTLPEMDTSDSLTQAEFTAFVHDRIWSVRLDGVVLTVVNAHCEFASLSPWNLPPRELVRIVRAKAHEIEQATGVSTFGGSDGGRRFERKLIARFGFLRFFNAYIRRVLRFFDRTWSYFQDSSFSGELLPSQLLSQCRSSIFTCTKNEFFTALLDKTANSPSNKSDDDYDYPEDLLQLQLNRPQAASAKCHPGTTASLMASLFGQAFDALHFQPLRLLRMVYSHPMDDGQWRSFKVKFEGEGVDDYGGPYREFFSQFFAELQLVDTAEGDDRRLDTSFLPFLLPSPNWRHGVGASRERFVLNGGLVGSCHLGSARVAPTTRTQDATRKRGWAEHAHVKRQLHREMVHFLGQMIGVALRTRVCVRLDLAPSVWKQLVGHEHQGKEDLLADLHETDHAAHAVLQTLVSLHETFTKPTTDERRRQAIADQVAAMDLSFTTCLSDGRVVELCPNGGETVVTTANMGQYIHLVVHARRDETRNFVNVLKQGIHSVIPVAALSILTGEELETRLCGTAKVDIALLQQNTEYDDDVAPHHESVQRFWRVLAAMDDDDQRAFLRFVWARARLPVGQAQFHQKFKIQSLVPTAGSDTTANSSASAASTTAYADNQLPKAHTCFFALQLPRYSTDEICRRQLLYAIRNCVEMDGDFRLADAEMTGWTDVDPNDQLRF